MKTEIRLYLVLTIMLIVNVVMFYLGAHGVGNDIYGYLVGPGVFDDFKNIYAYAKTLPDPKNAMQYTAFTILYGRFFEHDQVLGNTLMVILGILVPIMMLIRVIKEYYNKESLFYAGFILASYPVVFAFFRGNPAIVSFLWVINSVLYFFIGRMRGSYVFLLVATLFHPAPAVFGFMFVLKGFSRLLLVAASVMLMHLLLYFALGPSLMETMSAVKASLVVYKEGYVYGGGGDLYNNSLFMLVKLLFKGDVDVLGYALKGIFPVMVMLLLLMMYMFYRDHSLQDAIAIVVVYYIPIFMAITSPVSADYRLVYLLIPIVFMFLSGYSGLNMYLLLVVILPKHFVFFSSYWIGLHPDSVWVYPDIIRTIGVTLNSYINPVLLLIAYLYRDKELSCMTKYVVCTSIDGLVHK